MKSLKLKTTHSKEHNQILVKPPYILSTPISLPVHTDKNYTFSTVDELKTVVRVTRANRQTLIGRQSEEKDQVEKLNHWRQNSSAHSPRSALKKFTFRRRISLKPDSSAIQIISNSEFLDSLKSKHPRYSIQIERAKNKNIKEEKSKISDKNNQVIQTSRNELKLLSKELEDLRKDIKTLKEEILKIHNDILTLEAWRTAEQKVIQQQELSLMLDNKNLQVKKILKLGEVHEQYILKEKIRQDKQSLHIEYTASKEKLTASLVEKQKERDILIIQKRDFSKEKKIIKASLASFYLQILKQGSDIRDEGLRWIIKAIWELEQPIPLSCFPKFLDEESSKFLLFMAKNDLELAEFTIRLERIREKIKEKRIFSGKAQNAGSLLMNVKDRLRKLSCSSKAEPIKKGNDLVVVLESKVYSQDGSNYANELTWIKENIDRITKVMSSSSEAEVKRIINLFKVMPKDVEFSHLLKVLLGKKAREYMKIAQF